MTTTVLPSDTATQPPLPDRGRSSRRRLNSWRSEIGVLGGLVVLVVLYTVVAPNFASGTNLTLLLQQTSVLMIVAVGMTFVILTGEIDLSVGSTIGLTTVILAWLTVSHGVPLWLAIPLTFATGGLIGLAIGLLRVIWNIPSFIVSLGLLTALQGVAFTLSEGVTISPVPDALLPLWNGSLIGIPAPVWIMIVVASVGVWVLRQTRYGRHLYALGGNAETSRRYGINIRALRLSVFVIVQCLAVLGGLLYTAQLGAGNATIGNGLELNVIAGVVVGGVALFGGVGRLTGTVLGVLFIATLANGLTLLGVSPYLFLIAQGLVVIGAVWLGAVQARRARPGAS